MRERLASKLAKRFFSSWRPKMVSVAAAKGWRYKLVKRVKSGRRFIVRCRLRPIDLLGPVVLPVRGRRPRLRGRRS